MVERRCCNHLRSTCRSRPVHGPSSIFVPNCSIWSLHSSILLCVTLGISIDVRDLFLLFRLGRKPAEPITLPCRCLCSGCLQYYWEYVFSPLSTTARSRLFFGPGLPVGKLLWRISYLAEHSESSSFSRLLVWDVPALPNVKLFYNPPSNPMTDCGWYVYLIDDCCQC